MPRLKKTTELKTGTVFFKTFKRNVQFFRTSINLHETSVRRAPQPDKKLRPHYALELANLPVSSMEARRATARTR